MTNEQAIKFISKAIYPCSSCESRDECCKEHKSLCKVAMYMAIAALRAQDTPNPPLTREELKIRKNPVWCVVNDCSWIPDGGYYCLCNCGEILTPSVTFLSAEECLKCGWVLLDRKPEEEK